MKFKEFIELNDDLDRLGPIYLEDFRFWARNMVLPSIDLELPKVEKRSKIVFVHDRINPIYVQLEDGSKLFFTYDQFKRIQGKPVVGKEMHISMQRLGSDTSEAPSRINSCRVI